MTFGAGQGRGLTNQFPEGQDCGNKIHRGSFGQSAWHEKKKRVVFA